MGNLACSNSKWGVLSGMKGIPTDNHILSMLGAVHPSHLQSSFGWREIVAGTGISVHAIVPARPKKLLEEQDLEQCG
jgi:hypothetical protein